MTRAIVVLFSLLAMLWSVPAAADVKVHFHSYDGSWLGGRYPHAFVVFEGTLKNGKRVSENHGFTAKTISRDILKGPVKHDVVSETAKYIKKSNRHFTITVTDAKYRAMKAEIVRWKNAPGKYYDLEKRNCIHFVGKMGQMVGLSVNFPQKMMRKPRKWLNHVTGLNPHLGAKRVR